MAQQPDISSLLAMLQQRNPATPAQAPPQQAPPQAIPQGYQGALHTPQAPPAISGFTLPQPTNSGSLNLNNIKPVNTGTVNFNDALNKARDFAAERGAVYDSGRSSAAPSRDGRQGGRDSYRRSRSRSPPRRDAYSDRNHNPYRDERRDDRGRNDAYGRSRSPMRARDPFSPRQDGGGRGRSPPSRGGGGGGAGDDTSELIVIDSALVGLVIGRMGENLRRVEQETKTRIQFVTGPEAGGPQRQCRVSGPLRARQDAIREINRIIDENGGNPVRQLDRHSPSQGASSSRPKDGSNHPVLREGENSIQILVPDRTVGLIIGRGGETIRDLQEKSGCHVNIVGENKSINGQRPVNLIGSKSAADLAKRLILEIVESDTRSGAPPAQSGGGGRGVGSYDGYQGGGSGSGGGGGAGDKAEDRIMVPSDAVGMIIGKGGETIKEMQNHTGCKINVTQQNTPNGEREIGLIGSYQAMESAKRAIWDKVDSVRQRDSNRGGRGGGGGGGGGGRDDHYGGGGMQSQSYSQQPQQQYQAPAGGQQAIVSASTAGDGSDPYAPYGGYTAYVTAWYQAMAAQQAQQGQAPGGGMPGMPGAPGT